MRILAMLLYLANTTLDFSGFLRISIPARLSSGVESLIDEVVEKYATMPLEKLLEEVYSISEVRSATPGNIIL